MSALMNLIQVVLNSLSHDGTTEIEYTYDSLGRLKSRKLSVPNLTSDYYYTPVDENNRTSGLVSIVGTSTENFVYNYDVMGNITRVYNNTELTESYTYDNLGQMTLATVNGTPYQYTYDTHGNILTANKNGSSNTYTYGNSVWKDQLTAYNGQTITYDAVGNPLSYRDNMSFSWQNGHQLASATKGSTTTTYTYNADGGRNTKTVGSQTYKYYYIGGVLYAMTVNNYTLYFMYDDTGRPYSFVFKIDTGSAPLSYKLYYKYNLQGDVVGVYNTAGTEMLWYTYDPWGKLLSTTGPMSSVLGGLNPFLYRGYIYDYDTGLYYCNSRYYDPETGRWINADAGTGLLGSGLNYNLYQKKTKQVSADPAISAHTVTPTTFTILDFPDILVKYDVPLYNQGGTDLCWAFCQTMVEDFYAGRVRTNDQAFERAVAISKSVYEERGEPWDQGGWPTNNADEFNNPVVTYGIDTPFDLYVVLGESGPVYGHYHSELGGSHLILVTGVNLTKGLVYTNDPAYPIPGEQTYDDFLVRCVSEPQAHIVFLVAYLLINN